MDKVSIDSGVTEDEYVVELEVIGIYEHNRPITPDSQNYSYTWPYENLDNLILLPGTTLYYLRASIEQKQWDYWKEKNPDDEYYQNESNRPNSESPDEIKVFDTTILLNDPLEVDKFVEDYKNNVGQYKKAQMVMRQPRI